MPPVTAERSPPDSRITGADSPVMADSSTEPTPSMISPSAGMISPAVTTTTSPFCSSGAGTSSIPPVSQRRWATVVVLVARSAFACALPRPSAIASAKFANRTVSQSQIAITPTNQSWPYWPRASSRKKMTVVITLPSSTMNITGFRTCCRGSSLGNESRIATSTSSREKTLADLRAIYFPCSLSRARFNSRTFTPASPKKPQLRPSVFSRDQLLHRLQWEVPDLRDPRRLEIRVGGRDVWVDARARRRDGVDRDVVDRQAGVVRRSRA